MYDSETDTYTCEYCGVKMEWDANDDIHGEMWGCEKCGNSFCSKCFIERHGRNEYAKMMQGSDLIFCPDCYKGGRKKITVRDCVREYILEGVFNLVTGYDGKSIQFQGIDNRHKVFGCYNQEGDWEKEVYDVEEALDYIGLGGNENAVQNS